MDDDPFPAEYFTRLDDSDDAEFYAPPRLVTHLDDPGIGALTEFYRRFVPAGGDVLDLMTSWISHLPDEVSYGSVAGLGMNRDELDANPRLSQRVIHNLNTAPRLPFDDGAFDACLIALSVQYLTQPLEIFGEIARVLRPGGGCAVSFPTAAFRPRRWRFGAGSTMPDIAGSSANISAASAVSMTLWSRTYHPVTGPPIRCSWSARKGAGEELSDRPVRLGAHIIVTAD